MVLPKGQGVLLPPFKSFLASNIPAVYDNTLSYYEELCALIKYLETQVIPALNHNAEAVTVISNAMEQLKQYVDNYFDNLDVQEEINNKLDQMALDGTLQEIITTYIQANVAWTFDTVADMKLATNLVSGSYAQTLGFHSLNDGGGAIYKITNSGTANEMDVIAVGSLFATLILPSIITPTMVGAYADNTHDDSSYIQRAIDLGNNVDLLGKSYLVTSNIDLNKSNITIKNGIIHTTVDGTSTFVLSGNISNVNVEYIECYGESTLDTNKSFIGSYSVNTNNFENIRIQYNKVHDLNIGITVNANLGGSFHRVYIGHNTVYDIYGDTAGEGYGIHCANGSEDFTDTVIDSNEIYNCGVHCLYIARGSGYRIVNNYIHNNISTDKQSWNPAVNLSRSRDIIFNGNNLENCYGGHLYFSSELDPTEEYELSSYPCKNITISNNIISGNSYMYCMALGYGESSSAHSENIKVINNKFIGVNSAVVYSAENVVLEYNKFENMSTYSFIAFGGSNQTAELYAHNLYFKNNTFDYTNDYRPFRLANNLCNSDAYVYFENNKSTTTKYISTQANIANNLIQIVNQPFDNDFYFTAPATFKPYTINGVAQ